jgi:hypothetical protein
MNSTIKIFSTKPVPVGIVGHNLSTFRDGFLALQTQQRTVIALRKANSGYTVFDGKAGPLCGFQAG